MIIFLDWDGVIARKEVSERANYRRSRTLELGVSDDWLKEAMKDHSHFDKNREAIEKYTGINERDFQTIIMTDLFKYHYLGVVNDLKEKVFYENIGDVLEELKSEGHKLIIVTGLVEEIIVYALENLSMKNFFHDVYGNTSDLRYSKTELGEKAAEEHGKPDLFIGDREKDLNAGKNLGAKTAYSKWGHGVESNEDIADFILNNPEDIMKTIREI